MVFGKFYLAVGGHDVKGSLSVLVEIRLGISVFAVDID